MVSPIVAVDRLAAFEDQMVAQDRAIDSGTERTSRKNVKRRWRLWDKAATEGAGCYTVGLRMGRYRNPRPNGTFWPDGTERKSLYFIDDIERGQWSTGKREQRIRQVANRDGKTVWIGVEVEPGSSGLDSFDATKRMLKNRRVEPDKPTEPDWHGEKGLPIPPRFYRFRCQA